jgi:glycosyltransferase involved in cell wall biosynthesis
MEELSISYLITCHNETTTLKNLLLRLLSHINIEDEIVILDDFSDNAETQNILSQASYKDNVRLYPHALERNYSRHKNYGTEQCHKKFIFQIDADELPTEILLVNLKDIISENPDIDVYCVPRINAFIGLTPEHAKRWGWQLTESPIYNRLRVNWPDYQGRLYRRDGKIKWTRRLHEKLEGYQKFAAFPANEDLALYHDKTIETQIKTNIRYNEWFSAEENKGHDGYSNK